MLAVWVCPLCEHIEVTQHHIREFTHVHAVEFNKYLMVLVRCKSLDAAHSIIQSRKKTKGGNDAT
jgi:hypothetical protein